MTDSKQTLRKEARARRADLARVAPNFARVVASLSETLVLPKAAAVAGYFPIGDEADPRALMTALAARGHPLALPCVQAKDRVLVFRDWHEGDAVRRGVYGVVEPSERADIVEPSVVLVPLLAFDSTGHRLGYGRGYYDHTLAAFAEKGHVLAIGVGYSGQEVRELPRQPHDHPLDMIVTEKGVRRF